jgi:hypothetical protein
MLATPARRHPSRQTVRAARIFRRFLDAHLRAPEVLYARFLNPQPRTRRSLSTRRRRCPVRP